MNIHIVVGVRPDLILASSLSETLTSFDSNWSCKVIHTGQHYDDELSKVYVDELAIKELVLLSDIGHGVGIPQVASLMMAYDTYLLQDKADLVLILGNSHTALASAITARKHGCKVGHVDAGIRSFDTTQSLEINDALIDRLSDFHFTSSEESVINLIREGYENIQIIEVGNLRADAVFLNLGHAEDSNVLDRYGLLSDGYILCSFHHAETLEQTDFILSLMTYLDGLSETLPMLFILHPKTQYLLEEIMDLEGRDPHNFQFVSSQPYRDMLKLLKHATCVITDSQGLQEETSILGVQCLTLSRSTNRLVTLSKGTNTLHAFDLEGIQSRLNDIIQGRLHEGVAITGWDGKASQRIAKFISEMQ